MPTEKTEEIDSVALQSFAKIKLADAMDSLTKVFKEHTRETRKMKAMFHAMNSELVRLNGGIPATIESEDLTGEENH